MNAPRRKCRVIYIKFYMKAKKSTKGISGNNKNNFKKDLWQVHFNVVAYETTDDL